MKKERERGSEGEEMKKMKEEERKKKKKILRMSNGEENEGERCRSVRRKRKIKGV